MFSNRLNYKIINIAALMVLLFFACTNISMWWGIIVKCLEILFPFIVGFAFAYAFTPLVKWLEKKGFNKKLAFLTVILGSVLVLATILIITLPMLYDQLSLLIKTIMKVANNVSSRFDVNVGGFEMQLTDYLNSALKDLGAITSSTAMDIIGKSFGFIGTFIIGFVGFIYFLIYMDPIKAKITEVLKANNKRSFLYLKTMDVELTNYLKGLEIFMVIQLFEYSFLFLIIGHILASVVSLPLVIATTIICIIFPQLDGYLISPKVYGKTNNINPLITIMVVSIGGMVAGVVGIIVALPCYLVIRTTYKFFEKDLKKGLSTVKETI